MDELWRASAQTALGLNEMQCLVTEIVNFFLGNDLRGLIWAIDSISLMLRDFRISLEGLNKLPEVDF